MTPSQAQELLQRRVEDEGPGWVMDLERAHDELVADEEAARLWREGREWV